MWKMSLLGFPNVWKTLIKDIFVWSCEHTHDCNKIDVFIGSCEHADNLGNTFAESENYTFQVKILRDRLENNVLFIITDMLYIL